MDGVKGITLNVRGLGTPKKWSTLLRPGANSIPTEDPFAGDAHT